MFGVGEANQGNDLLHGDGPLLRVRNRDGCGIHVLQRGSVPASVFGGQGDCDCHGVHRCRSCMATVCAGKPTFPTDSQVAAPAMPATPTTSAAPAPAANNAAAPSMEAATTADKGL